MGVGVEGLSPLVSRKAGAMSESQRLDQAFALHGTGGGA